MEDSKYKERRAFMALVDDLCKALSYPPRDEDLREDETLVMEMTLEDIEFNVSHSLINDPEKILIHAAFGPLPGKNRTDVLFRILHLNRELSDSGHATMSYDHAGALIVYTHALKLAEVDGNALLTIMTEITWRAEYWKSTYFLDVKGTEDVQGFNNQFISLA